METKYRKLNKSCLFHDVNQGDETITKMMCTIYYAFINAKYNGVIKDFTEDDIKEVAEKQNKAGKFSYTKGGKLSNGINAVFEWLNEKGYDCNLSWTKNDSEAKEWLNRGYAVGLGIHVNKKFYQDKKDGKLDLLDYKGYKGTIGHATNLIKWTERGKITDGKEYFLDSYFGKSSIYECKIDEVIEDIDMATKYKIY